MATVTGLTKERMLEIEAASVVSGTVNGMGNLVLTTHGGNNIDAGSVKGDQGDQGIQGDTGIPGGSAAKRDALFGVPATVEDQVILANKTVSWFNSTTGGIEVYMAVTGSAGLNVPGASSAGWYPISQYSKMAIGNRARIVTVPSFTGIGGAWLLIDKLQVSLVAGRWYRVMYKYNTLAAVNNQAIAVELRKSVSTDNSEAGTAIDDTATDYTAPVAGQGKTSFYEFVFQASVTETVNLKMCAVRATGTTTFEMSGRKLTVMDAGAQF